MLERLDRWWFAPDARHQPGAWRILLGVWAGHRLWFEVLPRLPEYAARPRELVDPVSLAAWLSVPLPPSPAWVAPITLAASALVVTTVLGIATRASTVALALLHLYLGLVVNAWGYSAHASGLPTLALLVVAFAPGIETCSLDRWLKARRGRRAISHGATSVWPLRLVLVLLIATYFTAGVSQLRHAGPAWMDGRTLAFYLEGGSLRARGSPTRYVAKADATESERFRDGVGLVDWAWVAAPTPLGRAIAEVPALTRLMAIFAVLLELAFPLALLGRRPLAVLLGLAALFHLGVEATMQISFVSYGVVYLLFVDWAALGRGVRSLATRRATAN